MSVGEPYNFKNVGTIGVNNTILVYNMADAGLPCGCAFMLGKVKIYRWHMSKLFSLVTKNVFL